MARLQLREKPHRRKSIKTMRLGSIGNPKARVRQELYDLDITQAIQLEIFLNIVLRVLLLTIRRPSFFNEAKIDEVVEKMLKQKNVRLEDFDERSMLRTKQYCGMEYGVDGQRIGLEPDELIRRIQTATHLLSERIDINGE